MNKLTRVARKFERKLATFEDDYFDPYYDDQWAPDRDMENLEAYTPDDFVPENKVDPRTMSVVTPEIESHDELLNEADRLRRRIHVLERDLFNGFFPHRYSPDIHPDRPTISTAEEWLEEDQNNLKRVEEKLKRHPSNFWNSDLRERKTPVAAVAEKFMRKLGISDQDTVGPMGRAVVDELYRVLGSAITKHRRFFENTEPRLWERYMEGLAGPEDMARKAPYDVLADMQNEAQNYIEHNGEFLKYAAPDLFESYKFGTLGALQFAFGLRKSILDKRWKHHVDPYAEDDAADPFAATREPNLASVSNKFMRKLGQEFDDYDEEEEGGGPEELNFDEPQFGNTYENSTYEMDPEDFTQRNEDMAERRRIADDPRSPPELLHDLSQDEDDDIRALVAGNRSTPPAVLVELSQDDSPLVRQEVASNWKTPYSTIVELTNDDDREVQAIAREKAETKSKHKRTAQDVRRVAERFMRKLGQEFDDEEEEEGPEELNFDEPRFSDLSSGGPYEFSDVYYDMDNEVNRRGNLDQRRFAADDPRTPPQTLADLAYDVDEHVRALVAGNRGTPPAVLVELSYDKSPLVRQEVASNWKTPYSALVKLVKDRDHDVSAIARDKAQKKSRHKRTASVSEVAERFSRKLGKRSRLLSVASRFENKLAQENKSAVGLKIGKQ